MNHSSSKIRRHKCSSTPLPDPSTMQCKTKQQKHKQKQQRHRNPFRDPNCDVNTNASCSSSSMSSIEAPRGCLRFFLSHSSATKPTTSNQRRPKPISSTTPSSAPIVRPSTNTNRYNPVPRQVENVKHSCLYQWHSGKKPSSRNHSSSKLSPVLDSGGIFVNKNMQSREGVCDFDAENLTPLSKVEGSSSLDRVGDGKLVVIDGDEKSNAKNNSASANTTTPPIQASVSPEVQCGSSFMSKTAATATTVTPACYAAGHLLSGITDKRKCRPRGILTVGEAKALGSFDSDDDDDRGQVDDRERENGLGGDHNSRVSTLLLPTHASVHWVLSPCNEKDENQKEISANSSSQLRRYDEFNSLNFPTSPSSISNGYHQGSCNSSVSRSISSTRSRRKRSNGFLRSPSVLLPFPESLGNPLYDELTISSPEEGNKNCDGIDGEQSPFSMGSLDSKNIIQTPESGSSVDRRAGIAWINTPDQENRSNFDSKLDSMAELLQMVNLSSANHAPIEDIASSSFQFDRLTTPSNSVDLSQFQKFVEDRASWFSNSTLENVSQSQLRISWREGLVSRILEMDEFDRCRCLSDDENDDGCKDDQPQPLWIPEVDIDSVGERFSTTGFSSMEFVDKGCAIDEKAKEYDPPHVSCSCAESISTDGGGLVRSEDSDWAQCYKNKLFEV